MVLSFKEEADLEQLKFQNRKEFLEAQNLMAANQHDMKMCELSMQLEIAKVNAKQTVITFDGCRPVDMQDYENDRDCNRDPAESKQDG